MSRVVTAAEAGLTEAQARAAGKLLDEESRERDHLVVYLSGAHAYGFPSPDSDLDVKAIHVAPTRALLGLAPSFGGGQRLEIVDGVEVDYSSNELQTALAGILGGNGNYLERVLGRLILRSSPAHDALVPLARRAVSRRVYRHYRGFATRVLHELSEAEVPTAKQVLYVLRTALTGAHLLSTGELVTDVTLLLDGHGLGAARELIEKKRAGERTTLTPAERTRWLAETDRAFAALDSARDRSPLPEEAPNREDVDAWLVELRRGDL